MLKSSDPRARRWNAFHSTYLQLLEKGAGTEEQHRNLTAIAHTLQTRDGADAILLAGTDLAVLFNPGNTEFPYVDCAALHLRRILKGLLNDGSLDSGRTD